MRRVGPLIENFLRQNYFFCAMGARARSRMNPVDVFKGLTNTTVLGACLTLASKGLHERLIQFTDKL